LFSDESSLDNHKSYLDAFCSLLESKLEYGPHERDMVIMHHVFGYLNREGKHQRRTSTMVAYGDPQGDSAMAKTVGWPAAVATEMILNGNTVLNMVVIIVHN
jgi:saccharopine dehydrogenase-like NADP-dependent oxidoreductase